jgi:hypothetical protein
VGGLGPAAAGGDLIEAQSAFGMDSIRARGGLPAANGDVDQPRFGFDRTGMQFHPLSREDRGSDGGEDVEDNVAPARRVVDGVGDERNRLAAGSANTAMNSCRPQ